MRVIVTSEGFIPGLGYGPFLKPIEVPEEKFHMLRRMGISIINVSDKVPQVQGGIKANENRTEKSKINIIDGTDPNYNSEIPNIKLTSTITEIDVPEESTEEAVDEVVENEIIDEPETNIDSEEDIEETTTEEEIDLETMTKKQIISLLNENDIEVDNKLNKAELIKFAEEQL